MERLGTTTGFNKHNCLARLPPIGTRRSLAKHCLALLLQISKLARGGGSEVERAGGANERAHAIDGHGWCILIGGVGIEEEEEEEEKESGPRG
jgi:hypothetical protein